MGLANMAKDREELLRFRAMLERRINAKAKELDSLEEQLAEVDKELEVRK